MLPDIVPLPAPTVAAPVLPLELDAHDSIRANHSIHSNRSIAMLTVNGISIEFDASVSEEFLRTLIRAVRYAQRR